MTFKNEEWGDPETYTERPMLEALPTLELGDALIGRLEEIRHVGTKYGDRGIARFSDAMEYRASDKSAVQHPEAELWLPEFLLRLFKEPGWVGSPVRIVRVNTPKDRGRMQWFDVRKPKQKRPAREPAPDMGRETQRAPVDPPKGAPPTDEHRDFDDIPF